jgi:hypothetical protein
MTPVLWREVPLVAKRPRGFVIVRAGVLLVVVMTFVGFVVGPRVMRNFGQSKAEIAKLVVHKYAYEAYPQWVRRNWNRETRCPSRLSDLDELMNNKDIVDPWGNDYRMYCGTHGGVIVHSLGEDGLAGTDDDIWTNR